MRLPRQQFTIGKMMILIAIIAFLFAYPFLLTASVLFSVMLLGTILVVPLSFVFFKLALTPVFALKSAFDRRADRRRGFFFASLNAPAQPNRPSIEPHR